jgi:3',5'-cyclic AMP phosphodiesterase CpdA
MRMVHISDLHFWHITLDPRRLFSKRLLGMGNVLLNRARSYRMSSMPDLLDRIREVDPDHLLVTGDLTATALEEEFAAVREDLDRLDFDASRLTVIPGNHDRYVREEPGRRLFETYFGDLAVAPEFPWLKSLPDDCALLALDPTHPNPFSAEGTISESQIARAAALVRNARAERLVVACHYPIALPVGIVESRGHGLRGVRALQSFLAGCGPSLYCHGHVHAAWAFTPQFLPETLCIDPGPSLKVRKRSGVTASLLEIVLEADDVEVRRHRLRRGVWEIDTLAAVPGFFRAAEGAGVRA